MKWHVFCSYAYDGGSLYTFDTRDEALAFAEQNDNDYTEVTIIHGREVKK